MQACKGHSEKPNLRPFLKRDCVSITLRSWNEAIVSLDPIPFCSHTKHIHNASWGNGDYVLVHHDVFTVVYFLFVDKDIYFSCQCQFLGLKGNNHVAGCLFYTFFAILPSNRLVHSSNNLKDSLLSTNILLAIYAVSRYPAAGNCFKKTRYPAVRNFDHFSRNSSFNSSQNTRYLFRNLKRL